jgi:hypothetical protein
VRAARLVAVASIAGAMAATGCRDRTGAPAQRTADAPPAAPPEASSRGMSAAPSSSAPAPEGARPPSVAPAPVPDGPPFDAAASGEARRTVVARLDADPMLRPQQAVLREHFGAAARGPFEVQRTELPGGRTALLVSRDGEHDPMVLVVDRDALAWTKPRPTAGMVPPVEHLTIAPRPDGGVAIFGWVASIGVVAARMWADDSNAFGDFEVFAADACDALSVASAPAAGWIVACASRAGSRAARMREDATVAWGGGRGAAFGSGNSTAPLAIVFDTPASVVLFERAAAVGGDRLLAFRYGVRDCEPLWPAPVDLGAAGPAHAGERLAATAVREGLVQLGRDRGHGSLAAVASDGGVSLRSATRPAAATP